jgi:hypothetical protein
LFDPHERSHKRLHEAKQHGEAPTPAAFTRLGAESLLPVSERERKVAKYLDDRSSDLFHQLPKLLKEIPI